VGRDDDLSMFYVFVSNTTKGTYKKRMSNIFMSSCVKGKKSACLKRKLERIADNQHQMAIKKI